MQNLEDKDIIIKLLDVSMTIIKLTDFLNLETERDAFISLLVQLSGLDKQDRLKEKQLLLIESIISIATEQGEFLKSSWDLILQSIIKLGYFSNLGEKLTGQTLSVEEGNSRYLFQFFPLEFIDSVLHGTSKLNDESILYVFKAFIST